MTDREKVIESLNKALTRVGCGDMDNVALSEVEEAIESAIALLREQEPVEPEKMLSGVWSFTRCGACKMVLYERGFAYCPWCGRRIDWT